MILRIWPLGDSFCILPNEVVLAEDEQGAVDGEAVLFDRVGVVYGHCPGSLSHRLLVHPLAPWSTATPGTPSPAARSTSASASTTSSIAAGEIF